MAVFAIPSVIGPKRLLEWSFETNQDYKLASEEEEIFLTVLQEKLSEQLNDTVQFNKRLKGNNKDYDIEEFDDLKQPIGNTDGISWFIESLQEWFEEPINSGEKNKLSKFSHLTKCNAVSGIYIPFDFSHPIELNLRGDVMIIGSLNQIKNELVLWLEIILPWYELKDPELAKIYHFYVLNFLELIDYALSKGVALEIV